MVHLTRLLVLFRKPLRIVEISLKIPSIYPKKSSFSFEENYTNHAPKKRNKSPRKCWCMQMQKTLLGHRGHLGHTEGLLHYLSRCVPRNSARWCGFSLEIHKTEIANCAAGQHIMRDSIYGHDNRIVIGISSGTWDSRLFRIRGRCPTIRYLPGFN